MLALQKWVGGITLLPNAHSGAFLDLSCPHGRTADKKQACCQELCAQLQHPRGTSNKRASYGIWENRGAVVKSPQIYVRQLQQQLKYESLNYAGAFTQN